MNSTSVNLSAMAWIAGSMNLQGPHHDAEKSITTFAIPSKQQRERRTQIHQISKKRRGGENWDRERKRWDLRGERSLWVRWSGAESVRMSGRSARENPPAKTTTRLLRRGRRLIRKREKSPFALLAYAALAYYALLLLQEVSTIRFGRCWFHLNPNATAIGGNRSDRLIGTESWST